jgi:UDP:flavonoid glycosyltransferase YjiC (YdhE family)
MGEEVIIASDPEINKARDGVAFRFKQTSFMLLPSTGPIPPAILEFIERGTPPVYVGFGSNPISDPEKYTSMFTQVRRETGKRLIVSRGWAELPDSDDPDILYVDEIPFDLVFPKMAAVIYHGGTGTMASVVRAGIPQAIFPFMGDQFDNRKQAVRLGVAPQTCDFKEMTVNSLVEAINRCTGDKGLIENARNLSGQLANRNGVLENALLIEMLIRPAETAQS